MCETERDIVENLWDEEVCDLFKQVASLLDTLQDLSETVVWQRPPEPSLQAIQRLCGVLLRKVAAVQAKTFEWQGGGRGGV